MSDPNDFLMGSGSRSAKFEQVGDSITGTIESTEVRQQTDIQNGQPLTWDNGDPRMQLVVVLQTALREPTPPGETPDDGKRTLYVKGSKKAGSQSLHDAVASAVRASGAEGLQPGGTLTVQMIGTAPSETRGFNDRKLYAAQYVPGAPVSGGFLGTAQQAAPAAAAPVQQQPVQQPVQVAQPVQQAIPQPMPAQPAQVAAPAGPTLEQVAAVKAAGLDPAVVFAGQPLPPGA